MNKQINRQSETKESSSLSHRKTIALATIIALSQACSFDGDKTDAAKTYLDTKTQLSQKQLGQNYIKKGNKIYYDRPEIEEGDDFERMELIEVKNISNPQTFQVIDYFIGKDSLHVYYL